MSGKKKKVISPWVTCDDCKVIVNDRDVLIHEKTCPPNEFANYPYIYEKSLHCQLEIFTDKETSMEFIPQEKRADLVLLSNAALQLIDIPIGDHIVIVTKAEKRFVRKAWRGNDKQQLSASIFESDLLNQYIEDGEVVTIRRLTEEILGAKEVLLDTENPLNFSTVLLHLKASTVDQIISENNSIGILLYGKRYTFKIKKIVGFQEGGTFFKVLSDTSWRFEGQHQSTQEEVLLNQIGGLDVVIKEIENILECVFSASSENDVLQTKGIILYGPTGSGKSLLVNALSLKWTHSIIRVDHCKHDLTLEIEDCFKMSQLSAPSIIIIDDIDVFFSNKIPQNGKICAALSSCFDALHSVNSKTIVLATTSHVNNIDKSLRRSGRFDLEIEVPVPNPRQRYEILQCLLRGELMADKDIKEIADKTHGFVGADLSSLVSKALVLKTKEALNLECCLTRCLTSVRPSAMKEIMIQVPNVKWEDIGGQEHLKHQLRQAVEWPLKYPESFERLGVSPPRGVLMYGPPGCSKTMIAKALATESGLNFISVKGPELFSKWVGESEKAVREVFRRARQAAPSIVFFDELDALAGERSSTSGGAQVQERVLAQMLTELDGVEALGHVIVVGATNRPDRIDPALLRPGRLDRVIYVPLPDENTRASIFSVQFRKVPVDNDVDVNFLAQATMGYSGAEVVALCNEAAMLSLDENMEASFVSKRHFESALHIVTPRTPTSAIKLCEEYKKGTRH